MAGSQWHGRAGAASRANWRAASLPIGTRPPRRAPTSGPPSGSSTTHGARSRAPPVAHRAHRRYRAASSPRRPSATKTGHRETRAGGEILVLIVRRARQPWKPLGRRDAARPNIEGIKFTRRLPDGSGNTLALLYKYFIFNELPFVFERE